MTEQEIVEGNKIIAEFTGKKIVYKNGNIPCIEWEGSSRLETIKNYARYHIDWNWLIPIWYKFRDLSFKGNIKMQLLHSTYNHEIGRAILHGTIEDAFYELVEGIKGIKFEEEQNKQK